MNMKSRFLRKSDLAVCTICAVFLLLSLAAVGEVGRGRAKEAVCLSNVGRLSQAWLSFAESHDGQLVGGHPLDSPIQWVGRPVFNGTQEQQLDAIRRGLLFSFVGDVRIYRCPADEERRDPNWFDFRSFSIAGGANGEDWSEYIKARKYSDLANPAQRYVFVEDCDPRGISMSSWQMNPKSKEWVDPVGMWHDSKSTLGFADGHGETRRWRDSSFIAWNLFAMERPTAFAFGMIPPDNEREDIEYMAGRFPYKALRGDTGRTP
jgi:hypothetical protein